MLIAHTTGMSILGSLKVKLRDQSSHMRKLGARRIPVPHLRLRLSQVRLTLPFLEQHASICFEICRELL